jgi:hypothetical protein
MTARAADPDVAGDRLEFTEARHIIIDRQYIEHEIPPAAARPPIRVFGTRVSSGARDIREAKFLRKS